MKGIYTYGGPSISSAIIPYGLNGLQSQCASKLSTLHISMISTFRDAPRALMALHSSPEDHHGGAWQLLPDGTPSKISLPLLASSLSTEQCENKKTIKSESRVPENRVGMSENTDVTRRSAQDVFEKEIQRRLKIGAANRGRTPWNKGRKHSDETRERIKKRTIEALSDPKVRKKMSESPHHHSDLSKSRLSSSMRKRWEERRKHEMLQEKCYSLWAITIAEAAKQGSHDQEELEWDSYEKIKADMVIKLLEVKARAKQLARLRAERIARDRAEKVSRLAEQRQPRKEKAVYREKSGNQKKKIELSKSLKLKARLTKLHHRKRKVERSQNFLAEIPLTEARPDLKKWDIELIRNERMRRKISLADQIKAVKNQKAEFSQHSTNKEQ